jgi:hypothetical protein
MNEPYSFFLMNWDADQTAFSYAVDANGGEGAIDRLLLNCSEANKTDISILFDLIEQVYGPSSTTASVASLNVSEVRGEPTVTVRAKNEIITSAMSSEPAIPYIQQRTLKTGSLMQLDYVPAFWTK